MKGVYEELKAHVGHRIVCVTYAEGHSLENIAVECEDCNEVIVDADREPAEEVER
jgi:uncharacterized protein with PIN domain